MFIPNTVTLYNKIRYLNKNSFLKPFNIEEKYADSVIISGYDITAPGLIEYINTTTKNIIFDYSREILNWTLIDILNQISDLSKVTVYANGYEREDRFREYFYKGIKWEIKPYFIINHLDYKPVKLGISNIEHKPFLLLIGKHKTERIKLLEKLNSKNLLDKGHISFIPVHKIFDDRKADYSKVRPEYFLDEKTLTYSLSHSLQYISDYYDKSEFVVICESDIYNNKGLFITEKTVKAITLNKKIIVLGGKGILNEIDSLYYKYLGIDIKHLTRWCDTSYDEQDNLEDRLNLIVEEIKKQTLITKSPYIYKNTNKLI